MFNFKLLTIIVLLCPLVQLIQAAGQTQDLSDEDFNAWKEFKRQFNKNYTQTDEEQRRLEVFLDNRRYVESQNLKATQSSFEQGLNYLSDLTTDEINETRCGFRLDPNSTNLFESPRNQNARILDHILAAFNVSQWALDEDETANLRQHLEHERSLNGNQVVEGGARTIWNSRAWYENLLTRPELDYRQNGIVSRVKDQGSCGSCWAFATTGALESMLAQRGRQLLLSEQNLIDCSRRYGNQGCSGGLMNAALRYVRDRGIMLARDYPYTGQDNQCRHRANQVVTKVRGSTMLPRGNEALLRVALALTGPIPVAIDAGARSFHSYKSGVYDDTVCRNSPGSLNHAVLLVGYGTSKRGGDYWLLKNSWGRSWGDNGYIKIARNRRNLCGVATFAILPIP